MRSVDSMLEFLVGDLVCYVQLSRAHYMFECYSLGCIRC